MKFCGNFNKFLIRKKKNYDDVLGVVFVRESINVKYAANMRYLYEYPKHKTFFTNMS